MSGNTLGNSLTVKDFISLISCSLCYSLVQNTLMAIPNQNDRNFNGLKKQAKNTFHK